MSIPVKLGQFLSKRASSPDDADHPFAPSGQDDPAKDFLEQFDPGIVPSRPAVLPDEPVPSLSSPARLPDEPVPALSSPAKLPDEPVPALSTPARLPDEPVPPLSTPARIPLEEAPALSQPAVIADQAPPQLSTPVRPPSTGAPQLSTPARIPVQFAPPPSVGHPLPVQFPPPPHPHTVLPEVAPPNIGSFLSQPVDFVPEAGRDFGVPFNLPREFGNDVIAAKSELLSIPQTAVAAANIALGNFFTPVTPYGQGDGFASSDGLDVTDLVQEALQGSERHLTRDGETALTTSPGLLRFPSKNSGLVALSKIFVPSPTDLSSLIKNPALRVPAIPSQLQAAAFTRGVIPARFDNETRFGFHLKKPHQLPVGDDSAYVPMSFTDLRKYGNSYRSVYIRPFITSLSEDFSPEWNREVFYGRVDPVATYRATGRVINLSFVVPTFAPEDVEVVYQKVDWLVSMCYPQLDANLLYKSGPITRLRVGNVIDAIGPDGNRGLPGFIDSLTLDYSDSIWELEQGLKVPRMIAVALSFVVLHDAPIGVTAEGRFGGIGSFVKGRYQTPNSAPNAENQGTQNPSDGTTTGRNIFRSIGNNPDRMNSYRSFDDADKEGV